MTRHFGRQISIQVGFHLKQLPYFIPTGHFWQNLFQVGFHLKQRPTPSRHPYPRLRGPDIWAAPTPVPGVSGRARVVFWGVAFFDELFCIDCVGSGGFLLPAKSFFFAFKLRLRGRPPRSDLPDPSHTL